MRREFYIGFASSSLAPRRGRVCQSFFPGIPPLPSILSWIGSVGDKRTGQPAHANHAELIQFQVFFDSEHPAYVKRGAKPVTAGEDLQGLVDLFRQLL
jgi:hypothetical protein